MISVEMPKRQQMVSLLLCSKTYENGFLATKSFQSSVSSQTSKNPKKCDDKKTIVIKKVFSSHLKRPGSHKALSKSNEKTSHAYEHKTLKRSQRIKEKQRSAMKTK
jgi:hypothetical protein